MTDHMNSDQRSHHNRDQRHNKDSSPLGRAWGWSEADDTDEHHDSLTSGSAAGDVRQNQQSRDDVMASNHGADNMTMNADMGVAKAGSTGVTGGR